MTSSMVSIKNAYNLFDSVTIFFISNEFYCREAARSRTDFMSRRTVFIVLQNSSGSPPEALIINLPLINLGFKD